MIEVVDYETWARDMTPEIRYRGREWHNWGITFINGTGRLYLEDWINGERLFIDIKGEMPSIRMPVDTYRFVPYGNRNYSSEMWPEYKAIGAEKWLPKTPQELGWVNPPPPLTKEEGA